MLLDEKVSRLIHLIYDAAAEPEGWPIFLEALADRLDARMTSFIESYPLEHRDRVPYAVGLDPSFQTSYEAYFCLRNIYLERAKPFLREGVVLPHEAYCSDKDLLRSEYYNDFQRHLKLFRVMGGVVIHRRGYQLMLTVNRSIHQPGFSGDEVAVVEFLIPHLQRAAALGDRLADLETQASVLRHLNIEAVTLDENHRLFDPGSKAESLQRNLAGLFKHGRYAPDPSALPHQVIAANSTSAFAGAAHIVFAQPTKTRAVDEGSMQRTFSLTEAETRVASLLVAGCTTGQICERLRIQMTTLRSHLRHLLQKTQTKRQPELVSRLIQGGSASAT